MDLFSSEQVFVFMLSPIVIYLPLIVNGEFFYVLYLYHKQKNSELDAGDRFELPMHLAYETGVVTTLPA